MIFEKQVMQILSTAPGVGTRGAEGEESPLPSNPLPLHSGFANLIIPEIRGMILQ